MSPRAISRIEVGDCIEVMRAMPRRSIDAIVTDPPYGLGFMGKDWDAPGGIGDFPMRRTVAANTVNTGASRQGGRQRSCEDFTRRQARDARAFQESCEAWAVEALGVLKPGGYLLAMGGTRMYHRLASGIEDAGFEVRDTIAWLYGSGFPKSLNVGEGRGTALKPAHEPIVVARKSPIGTVASNVEAHGTGALNIDSCRIGDDTERGERYGAKAPGGCNGGVSITGSRDEPWRAPAGRWPANVVLDPEAAAMLDEQSGTLKSPETYTRTAHAEGTWLHAKPEGSEQAGYGDSGGASRFFYVAKPDEAERQAGLAVKGLFSPVDAPDRNDHPTVKPINLMRWLCRLVTPLGGTVLDPFTGSGTTGCAAALEGFAFIGIEREPAYAAIARARLAHWGLGVAA